MEARPFSHTKAIAKLDKRPMTPRVGHVASSALMNAGEAMRASIVYSQAHHLNAGLLPGHRVRPGLGVVMARRTLTKRVRSS